MLDFVNQRTNHNVFYKPTLKTMLLMFFGFITVMLVGIGIYVKLKFLWTHWLVWFIGVLLIYITCVSGVVYDIIHDVPFVGRDRETGEALIFTSGVIYSFYIDSGTIRCWRFGRISHNQLNRSSLHLYCSCLSESEESIQSQAIWIDCFGSYLLPHYGPRECVQVKKLVRS